MGIRMELGLFLIHATVGSLLVAHGVQKLFGWFGGYGIHGTGSFMEQLDMHPGRHMAIAAGASETIGGALLAVGLLTPLAAVLIASTMLVASLTAHGGKGPFASNGGWELPLINGIVAVGLAFNGAGQWSLDNAFGIDDAGFWWGFGAAALAIVGGLGAIAFGRSALAHRSRGAAAS
jgi:putative oxidoreductase